MYVCVTFPTMWAIRTKVTLELRKKRIIFHEECILTFLHTIYVNIFHIITNMEIIR